MVHYYKNQFSFADKELIPNCHFRGINPCLCQTLTGRSSVLALPLSTTSGCDSVLVEEEFEVKEEESRLHLFSR